MSRDFGDEHPEQVRMIIALAEHVTDGRRASAALAMRAAVMLLEAEIVETLTPEQLALYNGLIDEVQEAAQSTIDHIRGAAAPECNAPGGAS